MNFSDCIDHSGGIIEYSPDGNLVAIARSFDVNVSQHFTLLITFWKVYYTATLRPVNRFEFNDVISQIEWASDSTLILVGIEKRGTAYARNVFESEWGCKID